MYQDDHDTTQMRKAKRSRKHEHRFHKNHDDENNDQFDGYSGNNNGRNYENYDDSDGKNQFKMKGSKRGGKGKRRGNMHKYSRGSNVNAGYDN
jgi:hypothetical protein